MEDQCYLLTTSLSLLRGCTKTSRILWNFLEFSGWYNMVDCVMMCLRKILEISIIFIRHSFHRLFTIALLLHSSVRLVLYCYSRVYFCYVCVYRNFSRLYARQNCDDVICVWQKQNYIKSIHNIVFPSHLHIKPGEILWCFQQEHVQFPHVTPSRIRHNKIFRFS